MEGFILPKITVVRESSYRNYHSLQYKVLAKDEERKLTFILRRNNKETTGRRYDEFLRNNKEATGKRYDEFLYCPQCKEFHDVIPNEKLEKHNEKFYFVVDSYQCSKCGTQVQYKDTVVIDHTSKSSTKLTFPIWAGYFDEGDFVKFKWITSTVTGWNKKLQVENVYYYINFNTRTGQAYYFEPYVKPERGGLGKRASWYTGPKMINCSFANQNNFPHYIPEEILWDLYNCIYNKIAANLGYNPIRLEKYYEENNLVKKAKKVIIDPEDIKDTKIKLEHIVLFNRMPNLNPLEYSNLLNRARRSINHKNSTLERINRENERIRNLPKEEQTKAKIEQSRKLRNFTVDRKVSSIKNFDPNPVKTLMEHYKIPLIKSYRKILLERPSEIFHLGRVCKYFTDINNVRRVYESKIFSSSNYYSENNENFSRFMKEMSDKFTEPVWATKLVSSATNSRRTVDLSMLVDTADMYYKILENMDKIKNQIKDFEPDLTGNVKEMHDNFSYILDILNHVNIRLRENYSEEDLKYECVIDGYTIKLADDTHELRRVGKFMHICVGNLYSNKAAARQCNIALIMKNNKYVMCIELSSDMKSVKQAKTECNHRAEGELKEVVTKWIKDLNLKVDTYDLPELKLGYVPEEETEVPRERRAEINQAPALPALDF